MKVKAVLFDWNGTLFNDTHVVHEAINAICKYHNQPHTTMAEYYQLVYEHDGDYFGAYTRMGVSDRKVIKYIFESVYGEQSHSCELFPQALEIITELKERGLLVGLITAQGTEFVSFHMKRLRLPHLHFRHFEAYNKVSAMKSALESFRKFQKVDVAPEECLYVGDTPQDMAHAKEASVVPVAFLGNFLQHDVPLELLANERVPLYVETLERLLDAIDFYESEVCNYSPG